MPFTNWFAYGSSQSGSPDQQRPLRTPYKGKFLGSAPDLLNQKLRVWGPEPVVYPALRGC